MDKKFIWLQISKCTAYINPSVLWDEAITQISIACKKEDDK